MNFFASSKSKTSKKHASKKGLALGVNVLAASVVQNSTPTPSPASSSFNFFTRSCTKDHDTSSTPAAKPKSTKTRPRSSTTAVSKERVAVNATFINNDDLNLKVTVDSEALPPALTTLRAKPSYYEDLHTLSGYGELPFPSPVVSVPISPLAQPPTLPASGVTRLFEVAKPPAMVKRRRYTVATERPSVSLVKENVNPSEGGNGKFTGSSGLGELNEVKEAEELVPSATAGINGDANATQASLTLARPLSLRASELPCNSPSDLSEPESTATTASDSDSKISASSGDAPSTLPSTPSSLSFSTLSMTSTPSSIPSKPRGMNVNVRYVPYYPYMIVEPATHPSSSSSALGSQEESEKNKEGVLSRVKYRVVKV